MELITMIGGSIVGFIFRYMAERAKERHEMFQNALKMKEAQDDSAENPTKFFRLFGGGKEITFVELDGYLMIPEVRQTLSAIVGFYFGNAAAKGST